MNTNSYLCKFISNHSDWLELLSKGPYFLKIKQGDKSLSDLYIFSYNQYESDFTNPIVQEARGIIIDISNLEVVCWPFRKFGNYGENYADTIDWSSARVTEKIDGSIMKVWYYHKLSKWFVSTNNNINAHEAIINDTKNVDKISFGELFDQTISLNYSKLDKDCTYIFELCSPITRVIVPWEKNEVYHTGTRNNITGKEFICDIGIKQPKTYPLTSISDCLAAAQAIAPEKIETVDPNEIHFEGFVVNDKNFNRIKIKSYKYVFVHYLSTGNVSKKELIQVVLSGEEEEFLSYFSRYKDVINTYKNNYEKFNQILNKVCKDAEECYKENNYDRKKFAIAFKDKAYHSFGFMHIFNNKSVEEIIKEFKSSFIAKIMEGDFEEI